ncbi:unnamed protein product [Cylicocyclus nassatus]|nr:unnamed protein product [Cylicocyclus nassatus]
MRSCALNSYMIQMLQLNHRHSRICIFYVFVAPSKLFIDEWETNYWRPNRDQNLHQYASVPYQSTGKKPIDYGMVSVVARTRIVTLRQYFSNSWWGMNMDYAQT